MLVQDVHWYLDCCKFALQKLLSGAGFYRVRNVPKSISVGALPLTPIGELKMLPQTQELVEEGVAAPPQKPHFTSVLSALGFGFSGLTAFNPKTPIINHSYGLGLQVLHTPLIAYGTANSNDCKCEWYLLYSSVEVGGSERLGEMSCVITSSEEHLIVTMDQVNVLSQVSCRLGTINTQCYL